jgi:uncharacterized protein
MNAPTSITQSEAHVSTVEAPRYLRMMCKHFRHKSPTTFDELHGRIEFSTGTCELDAAAIAGTLQIRILANDLDSLERLEGVVASHLKRFALKDPLEVHWTRPD